MTWKAPVRLVSITSCHACASIRIMSPSRVMPALTTSPSMEPHFATTASTAVWASSPEAASAWMARAFSSPPSASTSWSAVSVEER